MAEYVGIYTKAAMWYALERVGYTRPLHLKDSIGSDEATWVDDVSAHLKTIGEACWVKQAGAYFIRLPEGICRLQTRGTDIGLWPDRTKV